MNRRSVKLPRDKVPPCRGDLVFHIDRGYLMRVDLQCHPQFSLSIVGGAEEESSIVEWVVSFFNGKQIPFPLPLDTSSLSPFTWKTLQRVAEVPYGEVASYREIAERLGDRRLARAVGGACGRNPFALVIPCHRIISASGQLGGFAYGLEKMKHHLLELEVGGALT